MAAKTRILLVDDDLDFLEATKVLLENRSYEVATASDGLEGLEGVRKARPDLIVLDVMMPKTHGFEMCRQLKKNPEYARIPVLLLTAVGQSIPQTSFTVEMGMRTEADDYLEKPVDADVLAAHIEDLLQGKRS